MVFSQSEGRPPRHLLLSENVSVAANKMPTTAPETNAATVLDPSILVKIPIAVPKGSPLIRARAHLGRLAR
jgi:hypothetical protein